MMRMLASHQRGPGFIQDQCHKINKLQFLYVSFVCCWFVHCFEGFSLSALVILPHEEPTLRNYNSSLPVLILWLIWLPLYSTAQIHVSYHFSSRFLRDTSCFSRDVSRFSQDSSHFYGGPYMQCTNNNFSA